MSTSYVPQAGDDTQLRKQSTAEYKLQRLTELTRRLKEEEERKAIPVSQAAKDLIDFTEKGERDYMVPSVWGEVNKREDPYTRRAGGPRCIVM